VKREYTKLVFWLTLTTGVFFGAGVIVAMLHVGPYIQPSDRSGPLVDPAYTFADVVLMGVFFGIVSSVVALIILAAIVKHDKKKCATLAKRYDTELERVLFLTQSCVVHVDEGTEARELFDRTLAAVKSLGVYLKVEDEGIGCIEAYSRPFFTSRITAKIDHKPEVGWEVVAVSTPVSGLFIMDFGRNFEIVEAFSDFLTSQTGGMSKEDNPNREDA